MSRSSNELLVDQYILDIGRLTTSHALHRFEPIYRLELQLAHRSMRLCEQSKADLESVPNATIATKQTSNNYRETMPMAVVRDC
jgi:hypothetical protein